MNLSTQEIQTELTQARAHISELLERKQELQQHLETCQKEAEDLRKARQDPRALGLAKSNLAAAQEMLNDQIDDILKQDQLIKRLEANLKKLEQLQQLEEIAEQANGVRATFEGGAKLLTDLLEQHQDLLSEMARAPKELALLRDEFLQQMRDFGLDPNEVAETLGGYVLRSVKTHWTGSSFVYPNSPFAKGDGLELPEAHVAKIWAMIGPLETLTKEQPRRQQPQDPSQFPQKDTMTRVAKNS